MKSPHFRSLSNVENIKSKAQIEFLKDSSFSPSSLITNKKYYEYNNPSTNISSIRNIEE